MNLFIINGLPGTGKTTIARPLSSRLGIPLLAKDTIKEFLFDNLGIKDREWSRTLGKASNDFLYTLTKTLLADGQSILVESAFERSIAKPKFQEIIDTYKPTVLEIYCSTDEASRNRRFIDRNESGNRHKGHMDHENYAANNNLEAKDKYAALQVGPVHYVDTTTPVDMEQLMEAISSTPGTL